MISSYFSFLGQEINESSFKLISIYSTLSVEAKISIVAVLVAIIGAYFTIYIENRKQQNKLKGLFHVVWKNSTSIKKNEIITLDFRPFREYYYSRDEDEKVRSCLGKEKNLLIVGPPLCGKTRMVYEALINSKKYDLIIPRSKKIDIESFTLPRQLKFWKPKLMFIDDLQLFAEQENFEYLFEVCKKNKINLIITCRSGLEYKKTEIRMMNKNLDLETGIFDEIVVVNEISEELGKKIAEAVDLSWNKISFNNTVGSIFMPLVEMNRRFEECTSEEKYILRAIKKLYICRVYNEDQVYLLDNIITICENEGIKREI